jgi:hypothetical protein
MALAVPLLMSADHSDLPSKRLTAYARSISTAIPEARTQNATDDEQMAVVGDSESNLLHAGAGQVCPRCGHQIKEGQPVRRAVSGAYQHDAC